MLRASISEERLHILEWLKDPAAHFPRERRGGHLQGGVTTEAVATKLGVPRAVARTHLDLLRNIGLLRTRRVWWRTHYQRDEARIAEVTHMFEKGW